MMVLERGKVASIYLGSVVGTRWRIGGRGGTWPTREAAERALADLLAAESEQSK